MCSGAGARLEFIPLATERFDLIVPKDSLTDRRVARLLDALASEQFRRELASIGGYSTKRSGSIVAKLQQAENGSRDICTTRPTFAIGPSAVDAH